MPRTSRGCGYQYQCPTDLTEVFRTVIPGVNTPGMVCAYPAELCVANLLRIPREQHQQQRAAKGYEPPLDSSEVREDLLAVL